MGGKESGPSGISVGELRKIQEEKTVNELHKTALEENEQFDADKKRADDMESINRRQKILDEIRNIHQDGGEFSSDDFEAKVEAAKNVSKTLEGKRENLLYMEEELKSLQQRYDGINQIIVDNQGVEIDTRVLESLESARQRLENCTTEFEKAREDLKSDESKVIPEERLESFRVWKEKIMELNNQMETIEDSESVRDILREEALGLEDGEIDQRLEALKAEHKEIVKEARAIESELDPYVAALKNYCEANKLGPVSDAMNNLQSERDKLQREFEELDGKVRSIGQPRDLLSRLVSNNAVRKLERRKDEISSKNKILVDHQKNIAQMTRALEYKKVNIASRLKPLIAKYEILKQRHDELSKAKKQKSEKNVESS